MKHRKFSFICSIMLYAVLGFGQTIKLGTVAPEGSPWHETLQQTAQRWKEASNGKVKLRIYAGGVAGDELDMMRKIKIGQLHATAITCTSFIGLIPDLESIYFPLQVRTDGELEHIIQKLGPAFERELEEKGFKVLNWNTAGWVHFFSTQPVVYPDDLKKQRLFFWGNDTKYIEILKSSGFQPVPLAINDLLPSLQTGLVDAFAAPPAAALSFQWFALAKHMSRLRWQPLPGVTVVSMKKWNKIPTDLQPTLYAIAQEEGAKLYQRILKLESEALSVMEKNGLTIHPINESIEKQWYDLIMDKCFPKFVGARFSQSSFDKVQKSLTEFRTNQSLRIDNTLNPIQRNQ